MHTVLRFKTFVFITFFLFRLFIVIDIIYLIVVFVVDEPVFASILPVILFTSGKIFTADNAIVYGVVASATFSTVVVFIFVVVVV